MKNNSFFFIKYNPPIARFIEKLLHHFAPSIKQLSPEPMPSIAIFSLAAGGAFSMPMAMVMGNETDPVLPRNSTVEKSFFESSSRVL